MWEGSHYSYQVTGITISNVRFTSTGYGYPLQCSTTTTPLGMRRYATLLMLLVQTISVSTGTAFRPCTCIHFQCKILNQSPHFCRNLPFGYHHRYYRRSSRSQCSNLVYRLRHLHWTAIHHCPNNVLDQSDSDHCQLHRLKFATHCGRTNCHRSTQLAHRLRLRYIIDLYSVAVYPDASCQSNHEYTSQTPSSSTYFYTGTKTYSFNRNLFICSIPFTTSTFEIFSCYDQNGVDLIRIWMDDVQ